MIDISIVYLRVVPKNSKANLMITTLFFIQLLALQIWYITSGQSRSDKSPFYYNRILKKRNVFRIAGGVLIMVATALFVTRFGWLTGACVSIIGLMGGASLVVVFNPLQYGKANAVVVLYVLFVAFEMMI